MKKTIITALAGLALAASASALDYTIPPTEDGKATVHGFYLTLTSAVLEPATGSPASSTLSGSYTLDALTLTGRSDGTGANVTYGLLVFNDTSSTIIGFSTGTATSGNGVNPAFTFTAADGSSPLTFTANTTYRFLAVNATAWGYADTNAADNTDLTYTASTATASYNATTHTISGGLVAPGIRVDTAQADDLCNVITGSNGTSTSDYAVALTKLTITKAVPEPASATLSLLALAGLAARRRRK